jgi:two-component system, chemotaxis family, chemotaxis protein CheY
MNSNHVPHVMVVEDDFDTREVVRMILEAEGMDVIEARDGQEALDRLHEIREHDPRRPCVILLDLMMPRCGGVEFRQRQLADPLVAPVPVIILSAVVDPPRAAELEAFGHLLKPFDPDELVALIHHACEACHHLKS